MLEVTDQSFQSEVINEKNKAVLVDFWAPWCGPCRMQTPVLESFQKQYGDFIKVCKLNTDENPETARQFGIMSIPTLIVFKNGELFKKAVGVQNVEALKKLTGV